MGSVSARQAGFRSLLNHHVDTRFKFGCERGRMECGPWRYYVRSVAKAGRRSKKRRREGVGKWRLVEMEPSDD
ncbi:hypothetical protein M378DRAFT_162725 [Amanita muscaria Koide BX008]|uniref:Uncharacterized protein n=1 Tax=Amanita muscaria (strain Koide BX008) TaxID=946122 RepID=A0A0C2X6G0_AMAMK|nr:hypothetical protein M378DRAFT_162725 [Amanita muscaria Koide BX008]